MSGYPDQYDSDENESKERREENGFSIKETFDLILVLIYTWTVFIGSIGPWISERNVGYFLLANLIFQHRYDIKARMIKCQEKLKLSFFLDEKNKTS
jgi:hypothetical protein